MPKIVKNRYPLNFFILLSLPFFLLTGCRSLHAPSQPSGMWNPPEWYAQGRKPETILQKEEAKKPDPAQPLKLMDLIGLALENNPTTQQAWRQAQAAQAQVGEARSAWYPTVNIAQDFDASRNVSNRELYNTTGGDISMSMQVTYMLFDFGGRSATVEQAFQTLLAANFQFNRTVQDLLLNVATAYFNFYSANALVEASQMDVKDAKAALDATEEKFRAGIQAKLDVLQTNSNYQKMLYTLEAATGELKTAEGELAKSLGFPAGTPFNVVLPQKDAMFNIAEKTVNQLIEEGLGKRPDIAAGRASLAAKEAAVKAAKSDLWPTVNLGTTGTNDWFRYFGNRLTYDTRHDYGYMAGLNIQWPLFEGFDTFFKIKAAEAEAKAEYEKLRQTELQVTAEIWEKYFNLVTAQRKLEFSVAYLESSQGSYELAMESYKTGLADILDILNAEASLSDARSQLIKSRKELYLAFAELVHAIGTINEKTDAARAEEGTIKL